MSRAERSMPCGGQEDETERNRSRLVAASSEIKRTDGYVPTRLVVNSLNVARSTAERNVAHRQAMKRADLDGDLRQSEKLIVHEVRSTPTIFVDQFTLIAR